VTLDVRAGYGGSPMRDLARSRGIWVGRIGTSPSAGQVWFRWSGAGRARPGGDGRLKTTLTVPEGQHHDLVLEISDRPLRQPPVDSGDAWVATEEAWAGAVPNCDGLVAARDAAHAHTVLTGLTSASGGMVAAATTSLAERLDGTRNYDYRYAWIRDQCYAGIAMAAQGCQSQLAATVRFIADRVLADGPDLKPAYTAGGEQIPGERALRLPGHPGSSVRVGNRVLRQFQLDSLGEVLQLLAAAAGLDVLDADGPRAAEVAAIATATTPGGAPPGGAGARAAARWSALADKITADMGKAIHPTGRWKRAECDERVDAALLPSVLRDAIPAEDPRSVATVAAVAAELADDGFIYRFRHDNRPLYEADGAFLLCGFWMALTAHVRGDDVEAAHWFERNRAGAVQPAFTPRSTTCSSGSCAGISRRRSCTRPCSSALCACPAARGSVVRRTGRLPDCAVIGRGRWVSNGFASTTDRTRKGTG